MDPHKFKVCAIVTVRSGPNSNMSKGIYKVTQQLPGNGECEYRIKSASEPHERVVRETEMTRA